ncbi:asparagine synthase-related protein [Terasakiella sp. SH-1]|uniref:asparagine synthase-related protein n=1 Tax=Terasakiella sp. SH-1 TaxID=2560057 RepID=UPI00107355CF|nr:asparagine synthase-related protein [Terasakiella sp. SH-1]
MLLREQITVICQPAESKPIEIPFTPEKSYSVIFPGRKCTISYQGLKYTPLISEQEKHFIIVFGHLIKDGRVSKTVPTEMIEDALDNERSLEELNGEFLIVVIDKKNGTLHTFTDRFASTQFHYSVDEGSFIGAFSFNDCCEILKQKNKLDWDPVSAYDFLKFRRVHGPYTLARNISFLRAGYHLIWKNATCSLSRYYQPNFEKLSGSVAENAEKLGIALKNSISAKCSDKNKPGIFLSGGHDTRTVLAACNFPLHSITVGFHDNTREILRARELAALKNCPHQTIIIDEKHYLNTYQGALEQNGSQYNIANIFFGLDDVPNDIDVFLCGTGIDYMFQGMYMPSNSFDFASRRIGGKFKAKLPSQLTDHYINNFSSRLKYNGVENCFHKTIIEDIRAAHRDRIQELEIEARQFTDDLDDIWHYLFLSDPSRHYSYPDNLGMRTQGELRTPTFENSVFDLFHRIPMVQRFDRKLVRHTLKYLYPGFLKIRNANDDLPIVSSHRKFLYRSLSAIKRRIVRERSNSPIEMFRTWPTNDTVLKGNQDFESYLLSMRDSQKLFNADFIKYEHIAKLAEDFYSNDTKVNPPRVADFLWNFMSLNKFISTHS